MEQREVEARLKAGLVKMHVYERDHNKVSYIHTKEILQLIYEHCPIDEKDLKLLLRISAGMDKRYITQYLDGFRIWGVIFRQDGIIYADKPDNNNISYSVNKDNEVIKAEKGKCKYDIEKHGMCEKRGIIKSKQVCENCTEVILLD